MLHYFPRTLGVLRTGLLLMALPLTLVMAETASESVTSPEDQALIEEASIVAARFLQAVDQGRAERAERYSYLHESFTTAGRRGEKRPSPSIFMIQARINTYKTYGRLLSRNLTSAKIVDTLSSMPDSKYAILKYELEFERKSKESESVAIKVDGEQRGKVVRYPFVAILAQ
jgi:hypothetical protein